MSLGDHVIFNGKIVSKAEALVPVASREVQCGFSVYESLRVLGGQVVHLQEHLSRLVSSSVQIGLSIPFSNKDFSDWVSLLIKTDNIGDSTMRIQVYGGPSPMCFVIASPILTYPPEMYENGVKISVYKGERFMPSCKTGNLLLNYLALEDAHRQGAFEAVLENSAGYLLEGTRSNFYAFRDNVLYTAPTELVLEGVTRSSVLKAAQSLGIEVCFECVKLSNLALYDEAFISSTSMGAMPAGSVGEVCFSKHKRTAAINALVRKWELT